MTDAPLIPAPLYGLRTWGSAEDEEGEWLTAVARGERWPAGGAWLEASCAHGHEAPAPDCNCGIHAWHPRPASARTVLASRFEIPGIVEAAGAIEVHEEGFRAARGRPYALVAVPGRNLARIRRLAERYRARVVEVDGPAALLAYCREHGLGLDATTVDDLIGPEELARRREERRRTARRNALRIVAYVVVCIILFAVGSVLITDPSGPHDLFGRTGKIHIP